MKTTTAMPVAPDRWVRLTRIRNDGHGDAGDATWRSRVVSFTYGLNGKRYPRLNLSVSFRMMGRFSVGCSIQERAGGWWQQEPFGVPIELMGDLQELLQAAARQYERVWSAQ